MTGAYKDKLKKAENLVGLPYPAFVVNTNGALFVYIESVVKGNVKSHVHAKAK